MNSGEKWRDLFVKCNQIIMLLRELYALNPHVYEYVELEQEILKIKNKVAKLY